MPHIPYVPDDRFKSAEFLINSESGLTLFFNVKRSNKGE